MALWKISVKNSGNAACKNKNYHNHTAYRCDS